MKTIRIGSGAGYAGDRLEPSLELIEKGNLDYISYECLAERTIAIGQQAKLKDPTKGYNGLLEHRMEKALPLCWEHKVKLITNMGSANPQAAAKKCVEIARKHGLTGMKIACVTGDDLLPVIDKYMDVEVWETHEPLSKLPGEIVSANACRPWSMGPMWSSPAAWPTRPSSWHPPSMSSAGPWRTGINWPRAP